MIYHAQKQCNRWDFFPFIRFKIETMLNVCYKMFHLS